MRCGKGLICLPTASIKRRNPHECAVAKFYLKQAEFHRPVATRTNALWQSRFGNMSRRKLPSRNPHECAVAKIYREGRFERLPRRNPHECAVAKLLANKLARYAQVATRANALWQRTGESAGSCTLRRRNPRECAVAKWIILFFLFAGGGRNPRECAVAKIVTRMDVDDDSRSQPARMRCGKGSSIWTYCR